MHVGRPNIGSRRAFIRRINDVLDARWLTNNGPLVRELEERIAALHEVKHCVAMCNGTTALEIAIQALGIKGGVILPSFTFVATAHALQWQGITPVFCDIDPKTHNLDPRKVEALITPRTTGIIGVHIWGRPCAPEALEQIAKNHSLRLLFDAAHAFGCSHRGRMIGSFGDAEVLSFHATKVFNTAEGGAVVTNDDRLAQKLRYMRDFAFSGYDNVIDLGVNGKMNELCAALGLTNLESFAKFVAANRRNYDRYRKHLAGLPGLTLVEYNAGEKNNWQYVVVEVDEEEADLSRDDLVSFLHRHRILARKYFWPGCHRMEPYRSNYPDASLRLPETERIAGRVLVLPTGAEISASDIEHICLTIGKALHKPMRTGQKSRQKRSKIPDSGNNK